MIEQNMQDVLLELELCKQLHAQRTRNFVIVIVSLCVICLLLLGITALQTREAWRQKAKAKEQIVIAKFEGARANKAESDLRKCRNPVDFR